MDAHRITPVAKRVRAARCIGAINGIIPFLFSTFLCLNIYAQPSNNNVNYSLNDIADSARAFKADTALPSGASAKTLFAERRDVYDVLEMLFGLYIAPSDTASKEKGKLYVAAIPGVGYGDAGLFYKSLHFLKPVAFFSLFRAPERTSRSSISPHILSNAATGSRTPFLRPLVSVRYFDFF